MIRALLLALAVLGTGATTTQQQTTEASGAVLRALDRMSGETTDLEIPSGTAQTYGKLVVSVEDCRFPTGNPAGNAYAHVTITSANPAAGQAPLFSGWMVASSPALNALDDPRYDVWVLRCITS
ncbi:DUF2155 domain-containing protein [Frigidibacter sp. ROC022]|uniref:DUF2155 domain-containing protein n=1 Tax=Frigidibacter sp. ROC022 TaxID=2971796 RepID=UPI00215AD556|nr:DUF2155 domain-containing protein [Frigidibacter sp. ROC022]MCR8723207.1 DUF2155 domain-containing protein [Frigidibacter sp. ROC022]